MGQALDYMTLQLTWQPPVTGLQNGLIREYHLTITEVETGMITNYTALGTQSYTVTSLHPFYTYLCTVAAYTIGLGPYTAPISIQMPETCEYSAMSTAWNLFNQCLPSLQALTVLQWTLLPLK